MSYNPQLNGVAFKLYIPFHDDSDACDLTYITNGNDHIATVQVGYDDETDCTFSVFVSLSPFAGADEGEFELIFCLIEYDHANEYEYQIWDGLSSKGKIADRSDREMCMSVTGRAVSILIDRASPRVITMNAYSPNLPDKALHKYHYVATICADKGYIVGQPDPYHGRQQWLMERNE